MPYIRFVPLHMVAHLTFKQQCEVSPAIIFALQKEIEAYDDF